MSFLGRALFFSIFSFLLAAQSGCSCLVQEAFLALSADHVCMCPTLLLALQKHLVHSHSSAAARGAGWLCVGSTRTSAGTDKAPFSVLLHGSWPCAFFPLKTGQILPQIFLPEIPQCVPALNVRPRCVPRADDQGSVRARPQQCCGYRTAGAGLQVPICQPCSVRLLVQLCRGPEEWPLGLSYLVY